MGGRGAATRKPASRHSVGRSDGYFGGGGGGYGGSRPYRPAESVDTKPLGYTLVAHEQSGHQAGAYPLLSQLRTPWRLITRSRNHDASKLHPIHTFGRQAPTLVWQKDDEVVELYTKQGATTELLKQFGLELDIGHKGPKVVSKRISRLFRPHRASQFFRSGDVKVAHLPSADAQLGKVWDGAGLVSRSFLSRIGTTTKTMSGDLLDAQRIEFTLITERGQEKGHAIVVDELHDELGNTLDFLLPNDAKRELKLTNGTTFVGMTPVHGKPAMRLDIQSVINLYDFFGEEALSEYLHEASARIGTTSESRPTPSSPEEEARWRPVQQFIAAGGEPNWFRTPSAEPYRRYVEQLEADREDKMRLPIPGGRYYVMPAGVGRRGGLTLDIPRGGVQIDKARGTAWVNDEDWIALPDSADGSGLAAIWGGADNDDALWVHPFTDHDGQEKVLAWRSPNQAGEYAVLRPNANSDPIQWAKADGTTIAAPAGDSRKLPKRIDEREADYLDLVKPAPKTKASGYSVEAMQEAIANAPNNAGVLGMYCNTLMWHQAVTGRLPEQPPASLEEVIDADVKTGDDLSGVREWIHEFTAGFLRQNRPIPTLLHSRLHLNRQEAKKFDRQGRPIIPAPIPTTDHWLDHLQTSVQEVISVTKEREKQVLERVAPPRELFDAVFGTDKGKIGLKAGQELMAEFGKSLALHSRLDDKERGYVAPLTFAQRDVEAYLTRYPPQERGYVLRGALVYAHLTGQNDGVLWLGGEKGAAGVGHETVQSLREIGLLDTFVHEEGDKRAKRERRGMADSADGQPLFHGAIHAAKKPTSSKQKNGATWEGDRLRLAQAENGEWGVFDEKGVYVGRWENRGTTLPEAGWIELPYRVARGGVVYGMGRGVTG